MPEEVMKWAEIFTERRKFYMKSKLNKKLKKKQRKYTKEQLEIQKLILEIFYIVLRAFLEIFK